MPDFSNCANLIIFDLNYLFINKCTQQKTNEKKIKKYSQKNLIRTIRPQKKNIDLKTRKNSPVIMSIIIWLIMIVTILEHSLCWTRVAAVVAAANETTTMSMPSFTSGFKNSTGNMSASSITMVITNITETTPTTTKTTKISIEKGSTSLISHGDSFCYELSQ